MKKTLALLLALIMCLPLLVACGKKAPKERLPEEVTNYITSNYRIRDGEDVSEPVNVDIASVVDMTEGKEWAVLGTYTVKIGKEIKSAKFGLVATYNEKSDSFTYSKEEFDEFK